VPSPLVPAGQTYAELRASFRWQIPARFNIGIACADAQAPDAAAVVEYDPGGGHRSYTFGELALASNRLANALGGHGVEPGARVGVLVPQSFAAAVAHLGTYKAGAVALPLSELFGHDALRHRLADSGTRVLLVAGGLVERVAEVAAELGIALVVCGGTGPRPLRTRE